MFKIFLNIFTFYIHIFFCISYIQVSNLILDFYIKSISIINFFYIS